MDHLSQLSPRSSSSEASLSIAEDSDTSIVIANATAYHCVVEIAPLTLLCLYIIAVTTDLERRGLVLGKGRE